MNRPEWLKSFAINSPQQLDLFMRANLAKSAPTELFLSSIIFPTYIMNPTGFSPIIQWYDRNPLNVILEGSVLSVAAPSSGTLWSYQVPAKRKAYVESCFASVLRTIIAAVPGEAWVSVYISTGGITTRILNVEILNGAVGAQNQMAIGQSILLLEGDQLIAGYDDLSGDGSMNFICDVKITEFDA